MNASLAPAPETALCPVTVGDVFTTAYHADTVIALHVKQRTASVWSVLTVDAIRKGGAWQRGDVASQRWTSIKVYAGRARVEIIGREGE